MNNVIPFPENRRVNPNREVREGEYPAPVVFDFEYIHAATERRKKFHRIMNQVDIYAAQESSRIKTREDIYRLLFTRVVEELKDQRYHLNMDVINAISRILTIVIDPLIEGEPSEFSTPNLGEALKKASNPWEEAMFQYIFSGDITSSPELDQLKERMREYYFDRADAIWKQYGRSEEDAEMMNEHMWHILPLIVWLLKLYMMPFRARPDYGIDHSANS